MEELVPYDFSTGELIKNSETAFEIILCILFNIVPAIITHKRCKLTLSESQFLFILKISVLFAFNMHKLITSRLNLCYF